MKLILSCLLCMQIAILASPKKAEELPALLEGKVYRDQVTGSWEGSVYSYKVNAGSNVSEYWQIDAATGQKTRMDAAVAGGGKRQGRLDVIEPSANGDGGNIEVTLVNATAEKLRFYWVDMGGAWKEYGTLEPGAKSAQNTYAGHVWLLTKLDKSPVAAFRSFAGAEFVAQSGDSVKAAERRSRRGSQRQQPTRVEPPQGVSAFVREHNLVVKTEDGKEVAVTTDGTAEHGYEGPLLWSPGGKVAFKRTKRAKDRVVTIVESSPSDQLQPKRQEHNYAKPGDDLDAPTLHFYDTKSKTVAPADMAAFANAWTLEPVQWLADSEELLCFYNRRGHQQVKLAAVSAATGKARSVAEENSPTFIDYTNKVWYHVLAKSHEVLWMSERDGWNHLYRIDLRTGEVKNRLTSGQWMVQSVQSVDEEAGTVEFTALGLHSGQDPYYKHFARVNFDGTGFTKLTASDGTHAIEYSPDKQWIIARWSRVDQPFVTELRRAKDGELVSVLETGDASALLATGWQYPERFTAKGRDGKTDIHGIIVRPVGFQQGQKYPVVEQIYAGPQDFYTPKSFSRMVKQLQFAAHGFVLVQMDGMGTNWRGKAFHDVCYKNLQDAGFPDRKLWLQAAAAKYTELDLSRVGVYGGSAGGQNAMRALIDHSDMYKAAVADCGCHDNRMDKVWWNEQWMGWPVDASYEAASNVVHAGKLKGNFLITWGELDSNVDPASSMQVVDALIKANKDFEMLVIPGANHGAGEGSYAARKRLEFFVRHLRP